MAQSETLRQLKERIDDIFESPGILGPFLSELSLSSVHVNAFERALSHFPGDGSAYQGGQWLGVTAGDLYSALSAAEQQEAKTWYLRKSDEAEKNHPDLFPK